MRRPLAGFSFSFMGEAVLIPSLDVLHFCPWAVWASDWRRRADSVAKGPEVPASQSGESAAKEKGVVDNSPQKTIEGVGRTLWESYSRIAREMGLELPPVLRVPVLVSLGGWDFEGRWVAHPLRREWAVEGVLELQGHEPRGFYVRYDPRSGLCEHGEGAGG